MHACIGEGNGNPLQYSCLENPRDRGAWWAAVYGVAQSQTRLKRLSSSSQYYHFFFLSRNIWVTSVWIRECSKRASKFVLENYERDGNTRPTLYASWETCMQIKKPQLELGMEQQTSSKLGKEYIKAVYCHPAYLIYMQSTACEMPSLMKHKLKSRLPGEIPITSDMQMTPPYGRKLRTKEPLDESERGEWKTWFKIQHSEN